MPQKKLLSLPIKQTICGMNMLIHHNGVLSIIGNNLWASMEALQSEVTGETKDNNNEGMRELT